MGIPLWFLRMNLIFLKVTEKKFQLVRVVIQLEMIQKHVAPQHPELSAHGKRVATSEVICVSYASPSTAWHLVGLRWVSAHQLTWSCWVELWGQTHSTPSSPSYTIPLPDHALLPSGPSSPTCSGGPKGQLSAPHLQWSSDAHRSNPNSPRMAKGALILAIRKRKTKKQLLPQSTWKAVNKYKKVFL